MAWNTYGYYLIAKDASPTLKDTGVTLSTYNGLCTYIKVAALPPCPEKRGYTTK
jgi:hypothetical protein